MRYPFDGKYHILKAGLIVVCVAALVYAGLVYAYTRNQIPPLEGGLSEEFQEDSLDKLDPIIPEVVEPDPPTRISLAVPYVSEAPDGNWTGSWKNACEEAAIVMIERFYKGETSVSIPDARRSLQYLFDYQDDRWGSDANSDAARTAEIANALGLFKAEVITDPTLQAIKAEIASGRPVLSLHKGFDLGNPNIPFLPTGSSYHTLVLIGYDDETGEFITHDDGDEKAGEGRRYKYDVVMNSLHDYNYKTSLTDGPPRVLFTREL